MRGPETERSHKFRTESGFYDRYMSGQGLDIGYRGMRSHSEPVLESAIGVDLDYPGYDGKTLPFQDQSQDYVFASHVLEHVSDWEHVLRDWMRVLKIGGYLVICVPHLFLYEKKWDLPSRYNQDHRRFYTPGSLLIEVENSLEENTYRVRSLRDNDDGYNYGIPPEKHCTGGCEIELVLQKIKKPDWEIK